ncbi:MAG: hypothetical protein [Bacteriophage sp.]|nr:MAG: hypothetical protein [Bacteriophage sp.]
MIPVTQFILGNSDPLLYPSEKMTNSIDEQIAFLQSQKQAINEAYRRNTIPNANNGTTQNQQVPTQGIWDAIDAEIAPLTQEQQNMLLSNQDYVNNYNALQSMVQAEVLNLVRGKIEASEDGKLFEEWFGGNIDNKVFESAITFWFKDVDFDGDKVWEYFHMNN